MTCRVWAKDEMFWLTSEHVREIVVGRHVHYGLPKITRQYNDAVYLDVKLKVKAVQMC